jgi:hypothetical protein
MRRLVIEGIGFFTTGKCIGVLEPLVTAENLVTDTLMESHTGGCVGVANAEFLIEHKNGPGK